MNNTESKRNTCQVCGEVGEDRRNIFVSCLYALEEISPKLYHSKKDNGYYLRVCKECRADFLDVLADFCKGKEGKVI